MSHRNVSLKRGTTPMYRTEKEPATLLQMVSDIVALANGEKEALGFLPEAAYRDAINKRRLVAMYTGADSQLEVVGFVLFSGVFPHARIQQLVVNPEHRRAGIGSALIREIVSQLEE